MIVVEVWDTHLLAVSFRSYGARFIEKIKQIPGRKYIPDKKIWTVPFTTPVVNQLRDLYSEEVIVWDSQIGGEDTKGRVVMEEEWIKRMSDFLKLRGYSQQTRKAYVGQLRRFTA
ncbi:MULTISPECIES: hypothetical protein [unclassified Paenibacillus]|uniref:hypothetical protein n=1 Tax=unclassified Paenibacillus TaxID=185978 RepID=UPI001AE9440B|nr:MULTISPECIES: hypothetical protein [unclassified Paenibacillus]MBP1155067.1 hypothetical protein [Paenibacillus sp. PvP091]MBP1169550.1 hypothetical protein [Paenibacillus sp. PvR098]MBP2440578.1 hypothetical protein [Paenibacillus sp. PvP052]